MINNIISKKIICCNIDDSFKTVSEIMKKNNIGFLPVLDNNKFVGVITDRDICISLSNITSTDEIIKPYITKNIISIDINSNIIDALNLMKQHKIKRLIVKNKDNTIGVLSLSDILNKIQDKLILDTYKTIFSNNDNNSFEEAEIDSFYL